MLMALQGHGLAEVVQEGSQATAGLMIKEFEVEEGLTLSVRHGEWLYPDGSAGFRLDRVVRLHSGDNARRRALALLDEPHRTVEPGSVGSSFAYTSFVENDYSSTPYPDRAHRMPALFRLYNVIEYFFPYKDLMDRPWDETLVEFVPRMCGARDATDGALAIAEVATRIQDSHVAVTAPVLDAYFGTHRPAVHVELVEGNYRIRTLQGFGPPIMDMVGRSWLLRVLDRAGYWLARVWPALFAYQMLVVAERLDSVSDLLARTASTGE